MFLLNIKNCVNVSSYTPNNSMLYTYRLYSDTRLSFDVMAFYTPKFEMNKRQSSKQLSLAQTNTWPGWKSKLCDVRDVNTW